MENNVNVVVEKKKGSLLWLWILLGCLGMVVVGVIVFVLLLVLGFVSFNRNKTIKAVAKEDKFIVVVDKAVKDGSLNNELKNASIGIKDGDTIKFLGMDIDNDSKRDLVGYYDNNIIVVDVDTKDENIDLKEVYANVKDEASLQYAYSIEKDKNVWTYETKDGEHFVKEDVNKVITNDEFDKNYYIIKDLEDVELNNIFDDSVDFNYGEETIDKDGLKDSMFDNDEIVKDSNMSQEEIKNKAIEHKNEIVKKEEAAKKAEETKKEQNTTTTNNNSSSSNSGLMSQAQADNIIKKKYGLDNNMRANAGSFDLAFVSLGLVTYQGDNQKYYMYNSYNVLETHRSFNGSFIVNAATGKIRYITYNGGSIPSNGLIPANSGDQDV